MKNTVWVILVLVLAGVGVFWLATSTDQGSATQNQEETTEPIQNDFRSSAKASVETLQAQFEAGADASAIAEAIAALRTQLSSAYTDAGADAQVQWEDAEASLMALEASLLSNAEDILDRFLEVSLRLSTRI